MNLKIYLFLVLLTNAFVTVAQTPLYLNFVSHNEITDSLDYANSASDFNYIKPKVKEICDTINSLHAKYNMQLDANFIFGCLHFDDAATSSDDLIEWASNSDYIDVDGHNHFSPFANPYNYADLAYLLDSAGVSLYHHILGGVAYATMDVGGIHIQESWTQYSTPKAGFTFTDFIWQADIIWGTATPGHVADYTTFGIWKPAGADSPAEFGTHDPSATLSAIGGGCKDDVGFNLNAQTFQLNHTTAEIIQNIKNIADGIQTIPSGPNDFYTMNMLFNFRDIPRIPHFADSIATIIRGVQPYVDAGKIVWATLGEKYDLWYATHSDPNDYFNVDCTAIPLGSTEVESPQKVVVFPNPTSGQITIADERILPDAEVIIFDLLGAPLRKWVFNDGIFDISALGKGIYLLQIRQDNQLFVQKIIRQ